MAEQEVPQAMPAEPVPHVVPPEQPKKGRGMVWFVVVLSVLVVGGAAYYVYTTQQKQAEEASVPPPRVTTQEGKPDQGFGAQPSAPTPTPPITSSDSIADIEKDISGTAIEAQNSTEFDADLQRL